MTAHEIDDAAKRIGELGSRAAQDGALAAVAFGLALAATWYRPSLALPLALGAMAMTFLAGFAFVKRFLLVDELADDPDAYSIRAVRDFGARAASIEHRRELARIVRAAPAQPELQRLIQALESERIDWDPQTVVALEHWLLDPSEAFRDPDIRSEELRSRIRNVLAALDAQ